MLLASPFTPRVVDDIIDDGNGARCFWVLTSWGSRRRLWVGRVENRRVIIVAGWNAHALLLLLLLLLLPIADEFATITTTNVVAGTPVDRRLLTNEVVIIDLEPDMVFPLQIDNLQIQEASDRHFSSMFDDACVFGVGGEIKI